jgi:hypothetical protein
MNEPQDQETAYSVECDTGMIYSEFKEAIEEILAEGVKTQNRVIATEPLPPNKYHPEGDYRNLVTANGSYKLILTELTDTEFYAIPIPVAEVEKLQKIINEEKRLAKEKKILLQKIAPTPINQELEDDYLEA